ncbi:hypothetical protein LAZ67_14000543 [Cordylochernes scorpioides]|uniref:Uncharacterized protein n=1 Tax=Cordylochernes scorpioides TaxID=51811 RepID=A0ABY6L654_9ARAC|nr:hypothetical protein LAZ67_14000543 [Cordylochernes scorpioides]
MSSQKRKRESITIEKKKEICQLARNNPMMSKNEIGERFSLPRTTVRDILAQAEKWGNYTVGSSKRQRVRKFSDLEDVLFNWFTQKRANNIIITDDLLREKRFKGRFHISQRRLCGEGASISPAIIDEHLTNLNSILANSGYDSANIYNADETGLFFQLIPDRTLAHKDENCRGVKRMKQRITVLPCCNSTGTDKRRLLIIGKSAKPRCFRNFSPHFYCTYTSNSKAWMTSSIFQECLLQFNKQLVSEGRRITLLLDNSLDSGIIKSFKAQYRKLQIQKMVKLADAHLPTELRLDDAEAEMKLTDDNLLVSTVTAKEELGEDDDTTVTQRLPSLREARTAAETVLLFLEHSKRATSDDVNLSADLLRRVYAISEGEKRQVVITDFFKKMHSTSPSVEIRREENSKLMESHIPLIKDSPATNSQKFLYADDIALLHQEQSFSTLEQILNEDLKKLENFFSKWHLIPNPSKTVSSVFHLNNHKANRPLKLTFCNKPLSHDPCPKYLGVTLDRSLTFRQHLEKTRDKLKTRNNIMTRLAGTTWGCGADTLRTTALALVYSVAEYCAPVWERSSHTDSIDAQLNQTMRLITGNMRPTPIDWLPYLSNIAPPDLRRKKSTSNLLSKIKANTKLPINTVLEIPPPTRLISRNPVWVADENVDLKEEWRNRWSNLAIANKDLVEDPNTKPPGYNLPRRTWSTLNRIRTSTGRCNYLLNKWNMSPDQNCDCGQIQTMHHILRDCPRRFFQGTLGDIHRCTEEALEWIRHLDIPL